jgi:hypothetical protein
MREASPLHRLCTFMTSILGTRAPFPSPFTKHISRNNDKATAVTHNSIIQTQLGQFIKCRQCLKDPGVSRTFSRQHYGTKPSMHKISGMTILVPPLRWKGVGIAQSVQRRARGWMARVRFQAVQDYSVLCSVQTDSGVHPASYPVGTGGSFPGGKAAGPWSWPLTSI